MAAINKIPVILLYGSLAALGMIGVTIAAYLGGVATFIGPPAYWMYLFPPVLAAVAAVAQKRRNGGILSFRAALKACFGVMVLALAAQVLFVWVLVHWIDPRFGRALPAAVLTNMAAAYRHDGMPEEEISRNLADAKGSDPFSLGSMFIGLARNYLVAFPVAVLLAAIIGQRLVNPKQKA